MEEGARRVQGFGDDLRKEGTLSFLRPFFGGSSLTHVYPCMVYLPTFTNKHQPKNVGTYTFPMDFVAWVIHKPSGLPVLRPHLEHLDTCRSGVPQPRDLCIFDGNLAS